MTFMLLFQYYMNYIRYSFISADIYVVMGVE